MISVELTVTELELLTALAADQLFRREFIDPKMPGYKPDNGQIDLSKTLLARLRSVIAENRPVSVGRPNVPPKPVKRAIPFSNRAEKR
jgi:hypothetical protein